MRNLRTILGALALFLTLTMNSGCTILLWQAALHGETKTTAPSEVVSAWVDEGRTLHLEVRFEDGAILEQEIGTDDLTPRGLVAEEATRDVGRRTRSRSVEPVRIEDAPSLPEAGDGPASPDLRGAAWLVRREVNAGEVLALDLVERRALTTYVPSRTSEEPKIPIGAAIALTPLTIVADVAIVGCIALLVTADDDDDCHTHHEDHHKRHHR